MTMLALTAAESDAAGNTIILPKQFYIYYEAGAFVAAQHFNQRNASIISDLSERLQACDIQLSLSMEDTKFSPIEASRNLQWAINVANHSIATPRLTALVGAARSAVSVPLSVVSGVSKILQVSASSTSPALDNKDVSPYFGRMIPTNAGDSQALVLYLKHLGVTHFGVIHVRDDFGSQFRNDIFRSAKSLGLTVVSTAYNDGIDSSIAESIAFLKQTDLRFFFGIFTPRTWKTLVQEAFDVGIMGNPKYGWLLSEASTLFLDGGFSLDANTEKGIAHALNGVGVVNLDIDRNDIFDAAVDQIRTNSSIQAEFISLHRDRKLFNQYNLSKQINTPSGFSYLAYDAVMSIGIAACETEERFFTTDQLWQTFLSTNFTGVSGKVDVHSKTGTRKYEGLGYVVSNVVLDVGRSDVKSLRFIARTAIRVKFPNTVLEVGNPYSWSQYQIQAPEALPGLAIELNLITPAVQAAGLTLAALVMLMCLGWVVFTFLYRKNTVVVAAQPSFLFMMCTGVFIMISAVIPMSLQEPISSGGLNMACLSIPWLLSIGFVTSFSSMFCRTWRLNKVIDKAKKFQRVKVESKDVLLPFVILLALNLVVLSVWSAVAPLEWIRVEVANYDVFGRSRESYGTCASRDANFEALIVTVLLLINLSAVGFSLYQSYLARDHPSQYNESYHVATAMASQLEAILLGVPVLILVRDNPTASFLVRSILVAIFCSAILLPMFVPKFRIRNTKKDQKRQVPSMQFARENGANVSMRADSEWNGSSSHGLSAVTPARRHVRNRGSILFDTEQHQTRTLP